MFDGLEAHGVQAQGEDLASIFAIAGTATAVLDWEVRIYASDHEYKTRATDSPVNTTFLGTLIKAFRVDRSVISPSRIGEAITIGLGEITLDNREGDYDYLAQDSSPLGQRLVIKMGDRKRPYSEWYTILEGYTISQEIDRDTITFRLRDWGYRLDQPASPNVYGGTGGTDGTADMAGKRKQRVFGEVYNVTSPLVDPTNLSYQVSDGAIESVDAVYVRGVALTPTSDCGTVALMNAASLSAGQYATCLAEGWFRIAVASDSERTQVTSDVKGYNVGGYTNKTASTVKNIMLTATDIVAGDLVTTSFTSLDVDQPAPIGFVVPFGSEDTVRSAVGRLMAAIGGWCGSRRNGRFEVRRFQAPAATAVGVYDRKNIVDIQRIGLPEDVTPPAWRVRVGYDRNWTVQGTDLAGSVTDDRRAYLAEELRFVSSSNESTKIDFPPGKEIVVTDCFFRDEADAQDEADRRLALFGESRELYNIKLADRLFVHEPGQTIDVSFPRFGLSGGVKAVIAGISEDDTDGVQLTVFV